jgi:hypothetical protein
MLLYSWVGVFEKLVARGVDAFVVPLSRPNL